MALFDDKIASPCNAVVSIGDGCASNKLGSQTLSHRNKLTRAGPHLLLKIVAIIKVDSE